MSIVERDRNLCQPKSVNEFRAPARPDESETSRERSLGRGRVYRIDRTKVYTPKASDETLREERERPEEQESKNIKALDEPLPGSNVQGCKVAEWLRLAEETFSTPSKAKRGEKGSVCVVDNREPQGHRADGVSALECPARRLPGVGATSGKQCSTSLDYRLTQGENDKRHFKALWNSYVPSDAGTYRYRAVIAGNVIEVYEYETLQESQKGKSCPDRQKREDRTEEDRERDRKKNLWRARKGLIRTINANVGQHGRERAKFFTMTLDREHETFDVKEGNAEFNKFIKRLEYHLKRKVQYTAITRFQDGHRPGGKVGGRVGVIHHHVVFYNLPYVPHERLAAIWGRGFVWINAIDDVDNLGVYVVEGYMGKEIDDPRLNGQKHYWSSRGLVKPLEMSGNDDLTPGLGIQEKEPVYQATYVSDYVGTVHYRQYNLIREGKVYERKKKKKSKSSREPRTSRDDNGTSRARLGVVPSLPEGLSQGRSEVGPGTGNLPVRL